MNLVLSIHYVTTLGPKVPVIDQQYSSTTNSITINWAPGTSSQQVGSTKVHSVILHINKCYIISKCIEVFEGSRTSAKRSLLIAIKF